MHSSVLPYLQIESPKLFGLFSPFFSGAQWSLLDYQLFPRDYKTFLLRGESYVGPSQDLIVSCEPFPNLFIFERFP